MESRNADSSEQNLKTNSAGESLSTGGSEQEYRNATNESQNLEINRIAHTHSNATTFKKKYKPGVIQRRKTIPCDSANSCSASILNLWLCLDICMPRFTLWMRCNISCRRLVGIMIWAPFISNPSSFLTISSLKVQFMFLAIR